MVELNVTDLKQNNIYYFQYKYYSKSKQIGINFLHGMIDAHDHYLK